VRIVLFAIVEASKALKEPKGVTGFASISAHDKVSKDCVQRHVRKSVGWH
jgi:hypothetical protein